MVSINIKISLFSPLLHVLILILIFISARDNGKCVVFGTFEINRSWTSKKGESHQHRTLIERHATQSQYRAEVHADGKWQLCKKYLFEKESSDSQGGVAKLLVGATVLARDAELCGRFKCSGCIFVSAKYDHDNSEVPSLCKICILNGGWTAVDTSVRAGTEARKFAEKRTQGKNNDVGFTAADERILYCLKCFAMGEALENDNSSHELELDLRENLTAMGLPLTTKGAQSALIQSGRWSPSDEKNHSSKKNNKMFEPWSNDVLESARMLVESEEKRKKSISKLIGNGSKQIIEDRVNLVALPVVYERNGKLIDAGLERTIISAPIGLTFESASAILEGKDVPPMEVDDFG